MRQKFSLLITLFCCNSIFLYSANYEFSLKSCIEFGQKNSISGKAVYNNHKVRKLNYDALMADYLPQLDFNASIPGLNRSINPITQPDGTTLFKEQNLLNTSAYLSLSQKIPLTGASISASTGISRYDVLGESKSILYRASPFQIAINQPIFQFNSMMWDKKVESLRFEKTNKQLSEDLEDLSLEITRKFFALYIAEKNLKNSLLNVAINDTLLRISRGRFNVGTIAENDLLQTELGLMNAKNDYEYTKLDFEKAYKDLIIQLNLKEEDSLKIEDPLFFKEIEVNPDLALEYAKNNRSAQTDLLLEKMEAEKNLSIAETKNAFSASINASFGLNQSAGTVPESYKSLLDQEYFNISLQVPILNWGKSSNAVEAAKVNLENSRANVELQQRNFDLDVSYEVRRFNQLQKQVQLAAKADTIASRRFEVTKNRYLIGKIDINTYFIAQNEKDSALRNYIQTLQNYWLGYFRLRRLTLFDFENKVPIQY